MLANGQVDRRGEIQPLLMCIWMLLALGTLMVASASMSTLTPDREQVYLARHLLFLGVAVGVGFVASQLPAGFWERAAPWLYLGTCLLLFAVLCPGVGLRVNGSRRWLRLADFSVQPSELAKLALPLLLARCVTRRTAEPTFRERLQLVLPWLVCSLLILLEPDLGSTIFLTIGLGLVLFLGGWPARELIAVPLLAVPGVLLTLSLRPYQWQRILGFIAVFTDPTAAPYQVRQSLTTVGVGGWWGTGLGQGWQKLSFLPEANTDFIFAVIGEELGLAGTLLTLALWWGVWKTGSRLLAHLPEGSFARVAGMTLLAQLLVQAAINVAVVTALLPPKGIPHPFISYGGSSLCVSCLAIGIIVSLSRAPVRTLEVDSPESLPAPSFLPYQPMVVTG